MLKRIRSFALVVLMLVVLLSSITPAYAYRSLDDEYYDPYREMMEEHKDTNYKKDVGNSTIYMHDMANKFTEEEEASIISGVEPFAKRTDINVLILTYDDALGKSEVTFSDDYMDVLFEHEEDNLGIILDMDNRQVYINTMGICIKKISDDEIEDALDSGWSYIKKEEYAKGIEYIAMYAAHLVSGGSVLFTRLFGIRLAEKIPGMTLLSIIVTVLVGAFLILNHRKANKMINAGVYLRGKEAYKIVDKQENYVNSYETVRHDYYKPKESSSSGSSHHSSSGRSHGGGGRGF